MRLYLHPLNKAIGALAQLVEQRTENPCVPGSIPGGTTTLTCNYLFNRMLQVFWFHRMLRRVLLNTFSLMRILEQPHF